MTFHSASASRTGRLLRPAAGGSILLSAAVLLAACGQPSATSLPTATVQKGNLLRTVTASGATVASTQAKLSFRVPGKIASIKVSAGDTVSAGQVLASLDTTDLQAAVRQAQAAEDAARAGVAAAQARVEQMLQSAKPATIAQAKAAADAARQRLQEMLNGGRPEQIAQAQAQLDAANQKLQLVQSGARSQQVQQAQAGLQAAQARLQALKNGPRPEQVAVLQQQVQAAKDALYAAQTARDGQCNPHNPDYVCSAANSQVAMAQTNVSLAQKQLQLATAPPTATDLQQAQAGVEQAQAELSLLESNTPQDIQQVRDGVIQAQQALALAKQPYTAQQIQQQRDAVAQAEAAVQLASKPYTDADLAAAQSGVQQAQAQVAQAQAALQTAQDNLAYADLKAPASGKILQANNAVGELVSPANIPFVLGVGAVLIDASLSETAVTQVKMGDQATVRFDALPGKVYQGKVADVPPAASTAQNLITYVATIKLDAPDKSIRPGMSASVTIDTLRRDGVLLVPNLAVQSYQGHNVVQVVQASGPSRQTPVRTGASDGRDTEIVSGLSLGQTVALTQKPLNGLPLTPASSSPASSGNPGPAPKTSGASASPARGGAAS